MINLLFVYERDMATVSAMRNTMEHLFQDEEVNCIFKINTKVSSKDISCADVLVLIRADNILSRSIAVQAEKTGAFIIFCMDDDLFHLPGAMPSIPWKRKALKDNLKIADMILSPNPYICELYYTFTRQKRGVSIDTPVAEEEIHMAVSERKHDDCTKIVYAAGRNHEDLFYKYVYPILPQLSDRYKNKISLSFVGVCPKINPNNYKFCINYYESKPLLEYREFMKLQNFDIGLAPLNDNAFNRCKYFNKYIEYTMVGTVGIYSNCKPYTYVIKDKVNGFLADNKPDNWFETICKAIDNRNICQNCYENAVTQMKTEFNYDTIKRKMIMNIPELLQKKTHKRKCRSLVIDKIIYKIVRNADRAYLFIFYLRRSGINEVIKRIGIHIKERKNFS